MSWIKNTKTWIRVIFFFEFKLIVGLSELRVVIISWLIVFVSSLPLLGTYIKVWVLRYTTKICKHNYHDKTYIHSLLHISMHRILRINYISNIILPNPKILDISSIKSSKIMSCHVDHYSSSPHTILSTHVKFKS